MGQWVVEEQKGKFRAVGGYMKVEQTVQCVLKGPGGHYVVGQTGNAAAVAEFELLFHEVGSIASLLSVLTADRTSEHLESKFQACYSKT